MSDTNAPWWLLAAGSGLLAPIFVMIPERRYAHGCCGVPPDDAQRIELRQLLGEGHAGAARRYQLACPSLERVGEEVDRRDTLDEWDRPLLYGCSVDGEALTIMIASSGEDGVVGTADDLREWTRSTR
jgi:hypothetical protein